MLIPNKIYDVLKWVLLIVVPAFITLLTALTMAWHWDIPLEAIVTTITATATFLGAVLGISSAVYNSTDADHPEGKDGSEL